MALATAAEAAAGAFPDDQQAVPASKGGISQHTGAASPHSTLPTRCGCRRRRNAVGDGGDVSRKRQRRKMIATRSFVWQQIRQQVQKGKHPKMFHVVLEAVEANKRMVHTSGP